jgi:hypothetical protein
MNGTALQATRPVTAIQRHPYRERLLEKDIVLGYLEEEEIYKLLDGSIGIK